MSTVWARSYPIKEITKTNASGQKYSYALPIIQDANYILYKNSPLYRQTYTMLRWSTYFDGRDMWLGGHQGVDIASNEGTPVYAVATGEVVFAGVKWDRGKTITIKHMQNWNAIYSSYSHLSEISAVSGAKVNEWVLIGKVGATGNATWPHLHWQIEINEDDNHPFFYRSCAWTISEIVNEARCEKQMRLNTTDPILFVEKKWKIPLFRDTTSQKNTFTNSFANSTDIMFSGYTGGILKKTSIQNVLISPKTTNKKNAILDTWVRIIYDKKLVKIIPERFEVLNNKQIMIVPQNTGITTITFMYGSKIIKKVPLIITDQYFGQQIEKALAKQPSMFKWFFN